MSVDVNTNGEALIYLTLLHPCTLSAIFQETRMCPQLRNGGWKPSNTLDRLRRRMGIANPPAFSSHIKTHSFKNILCSTVQLPPSLLLFSLSFPLYSFPSVASSAMIDSLEEGEGCVRAHISSPLSDTKVSLSRESSAPGAPATSLREEIFFTTISCLIQVASDFSCIQLRVDLLRHKKVCHVRMFAYYH